MKTHRMSDQPCFALYSAVNAITRAYRPLLDPLDLTYTQYVVMMTLWEQDGVDLRTLAERTHLDPPTLTPVVKRLEGKGLLHRGRVPGDERRLVLTVTEAGRRLRQEARDVPEMMLCQVGLSPAEERQLRALCDQIRHTLATGRRPPDAAAANPPAGKHQGRP
ncbi:MarR family winged helix-turn-helix transcriptional regulator [Thermoactinospora rubra]|uniref:MarR family winged helix-turn-helix transcriptional regulator n=1 Tax=Thermoactinospora rubra TaxID=1088767 RepID=UPI001180D376|nr:MarR family transcriptional regulator [Thermoactinospora rubra]